VYEQVPNHELRIEAIPPTDADDATIYWFAMSFNGYLVLAGDITGGLQRIREASAPSLTELRTDLFAVMRGQRFLGTPLNEKRRAYVSRLLQEIRAKVEASDLA
jgi:hypothetical protein